MGVANMRQTIDPESAPVSDGSTPFPVSGTASGEDVLAELGALVHDDMQACNRAILARMDSSVALIPQLAAHIVAAGGKRLRPLLTPRVRADVRLSRPGGRPGTAACGAGRLRRVHSHRDAAA